MSKKNYIAIAAVVRRALSVHPLDAQGIDLTARALADYFATENPRFDRARFLAACRLEDVT